MNILTKVAFKSMSRSKTRTLVTLVGIILSAAMFTAVVTMGVSMWDFLVRGEICNNGDYFIQYDYVSEDIVTQLKESPDITHLADLQILGRVDLEDGTEHAWLVGAADRAFLDTMPLKLLEGRLPQNSRELVIPKKALEPMKSAGLDPELGSTLTFRVQDQPAGPEPQSPRAPYLATYTIVGYIEGSMYQDYDLFLRHLITLADGEQQTPLWHRCFVKTALSDILDRFNAEDGLTKRLNRSLMGLYGVTGYSNYNQALLALMVVLCIIITVGSVSLIYNAFSISVSERTKQFGLLCSIGATGKQLRRVVLTEALLLCAAGIPLGVLAGYGGIAVTLSLLAPRIDQILSMGDGSVTLRALFSVPGLLAAAVIALMTVLISAAIPARRAKGVSPMAAIRQQQDFRQPRKNRKLSPLALKLFGLSGAMGKKYYTVSRKKYRTTVISLVVSFTLFVSAACFSGTMQNMVSNAVTVQSFDFSVRSDPASLEALKDQLFVDQSAYMHQEPYTAYTPDHQLSQEMLAAWPEIQDYYSESTRNTAQIRVFYLEDAVLRAYLESCGIDPEPYWEDHRNLVCRKDFTVYGIREGEQNRYDYEFDLFSEETQELMLFDFNAPEELLNRLGCPPEEVISTYETGPDGEVLLKLRWAMESPETVEGHTYRLEFQQTGPGETLVSYYRQGFGTTQPVTTRSYRGPVLKLGETIRDLPFGIPSGAVDQYFYTSLIAPLSTAPENPDRELLLNLTVTDYPAALTYISNHFEHQDYNDIRSSEENSRTLQLMINVFSYGFIILISLISVANVFNTISTNVALRRRDFGMLRSIGFRERDLVRMLCYECAIYGFRALLISVPLSLLIGYLIWHIDAGTYTSSYTPPWFPMAIGTLSIFLVVFTAMFYSISRLKQDDPIQAIRRDSL